MLTFLRTQIIYCVHHNFKVDTFKSQDFKTMCHLLKERYFTHNDDISTFKDIRLLDQNNKLVGVYSASQARKKAANMKKDITLINPNSTPIICRVIPFRNNILNKFFEEIVYKHNEKLLSKANSIKQLKISLSLNSSELKVKAKQIIQLSKKNIKVRVFMNCKSDSRDECLQKLQLVKSDIQGKCLIDQDIRNYKEQSSTDKPKSEKPFNMKQQTQTYSFTCKSRANQFMQTLKESSQKNPDQAIQNFLKKFYKQDDVDMLDMKSQGQDIFQNFQEVNIQQQLTPAEIKEKQKTDAAKLNARTKGTSVQKPAQPNLDNYFLRQAKARIMHHRLKVLMGWAY